MPLAFDDVSADKLNQDATAVAQVLRGQVLTSEALDLVEGQLEAQPESVTQQGADQADRGLKDSLEQQMYNTLLNTGYIPIGEGGVPQVAVLTDADGNKFQ